MEPLSISKSDLISALTTHFELFSEAWFLNPETSQVLLLTDEDGRPDDLSNADNYLVIEPTSSRESYMIMTDFVDSLEDGEVANQLVLALNQAKPFRRF